MMQEICQIYSYDYAIMLPMILITGGTGFIGRELIMQILSTGRLFRVLIHPEEKTQNLPKGVDLDAAISSFTDERGLKAILKDVEVAYYISSADQASSEIDLQQTEVREVETFMHSAEQAGVERIIYLSHLGADRASGSIAEAKGIAEHIIKESSLKYTILRSSIAYGEGDVFTKNLANLIRFFHTMYLFPVIPAFCCSQSGLRIWLHASYGV